MLPSTIDQVIEQLEDLIQTSKETQNPIGIFAALYQKVTIAVKDGIRTGRFEDGYRMEKLDVIFANRFLEAYRLYYSKETPTASWLCAFRAAEKSDHILLQHLLMGINAHINLDLGIAAAETMNGQELRGLEKDFSMINVILFELMEEVQDSISKVSPLFFLVDWLGGMKDEKFAEFSLKAARIHAWTVAQQFHQLPVEYHKKRLLKLDELVAKLARLIQYPGVLKKNVIRLVRFFEPKNVSKIINHLHGPPLNLQTKRAS